MATKIITVAASPPTESTGADYNKGAPLNATEFDQNLVNLRAAVDRKLNADNGTATFAAGTASAPSISQTGDTNTGMYFPAADTVALSTAGTERMRVNSNGLVSVSSNLTIGSNSDYGKLAVLAPSGFTSNVMIAGVSGVCNGFQLANDASNNLQLIFSNKDGEKSRIDSSGNLLVGVGSGSYHRFVKSNSTSSVLEASNTANTSGDACLATVLGSNCNNTSSYHFSCWTGGTNKSGIYGNGTSYGMSDGRYKKNITTSRSYLDDICLVRVVKYRWKDNPDSSPEELGVIAQELEQIFPGMVGSNPVYSERQKLDDSGKPIYEQKEITPPTIDEKTGSVITPAVYGDDLDKPIMEQYLTGETTKSVKYSVFVPMLITAVQTLKADRDALLARIEALEARL